MADEGSTGNLSKNSIMRNKPKTLTAFAVGVFIFILICHIMRERRFLMDILGKYLKEDSDYLYRAMAFNFTLSFEQVLQVLKQAVGKVR